MSSQLKIEIQNWDKFNPRNDLKHPSWFRLNNNLFEDPDFFDFSPSEILCWIYILGLASKKQSGNVSINIAHAERIGRLDFAVLVAAVKKLENIQCIKIVELPDVTPTLRARDEDVTHTSHYKQTNNTNKQEIQVAEKSKPKKPKDPPEALRARADLKATWLMLYQETFNHPYEGANSKFFNSVIKKIHDTYGSEKSAQLMETYVKWNNPKVSSAGHPLHWLLNSVHALMAQLHRPDDTMRRVAQGRAVERVLTDSQQRLAELKVLNEQSISKQPHHQLSSPGSGQISGSAEVGVLENGNRLDGPKPLRLAGA
jgi:hypothetical protein